MVIPNLHQQQQLATDSGNIKQMTITNHERTHCWIAKLTTKTLKKRHKNSV
jgi:hypothetical protein